MTWIISFVSQKGGVGKSTLSQLLSKAYVKNNFKVLLADMDVQQMSSCEWALNGKANGVIDLPDVKEFEHVKDVLTIKDQYDMVVFDGRPSASAQTLEIAKASDLIILPTSASKYDMNPQIKLAHEFRSKNIEIKRIAFVFNRISTTKKNLANAYDYISQTNYACLPVPIFQKTNYEQALEGGKALYETRSGSLNYKAADLLSAIAAILLKLN